MAEKAARNKCRAEKAAALVSVATSPGAREPSQDPQGPVDPSISPGPSAGGESGSSAAVKQKKKEGKKAWNPVVHQDYLEKQLHIFQDQHISKLTVAQPPTVRAFGHPGPSTTDPGGPGSFTSHTSRLSPSTGPRTLGSDPSPGPGYQSPLQRPDPGAEGTAFPTLWSTG